MRNQLFLGTALLFLLGAGCERATENEQSPDEARAFSKVPLRVAVVESEEFAERIATGWLGFAEQPMDTMVVSLAEASDAAKRSDVMLIPASELGNLVRANLLSRLPSVFLESAELAFDRILPQLRQTQTRWRGDTYALSLGSPVAATLVHVELSDSEELDTITYDQFSELAEIASAETPSAAEPLGHGEAAISLLRRAAAYSTTRWLFDYDTMSPTIDEPPYVQALKDMISVRKHYPEELLTTVEIWQRITQGDLKLAIGMPMDIAEIEESASIRVLPLPNAAKHFRKAWIDGSPESTRVFLPGSGMVGVIPKACCQTSAARALLVWISAEGRDSLRRISPNISAVYAEQLDESIGRMQSVAVSDYDDIARDYLSHSTNHPALRLPGSQRYLEALNTAVLDALSGNATATEALGKAKTQWQEITDELGSEAQKDAWEENRAN